MPIYEYQCKQCGHEMEAMQKISDKPLRKCPECGKSSLTKLISAGAFVLKGSGWYVTDFRDKGKKMPAHGSGNGKNGKAKVSDGDSKAKSTSSSSAKSSDSKPEASATAS